MPVTFEYIGLHYLFNKTTISCDIINFLQNIELEYSVVLRVYVQKAYFQEALDPCV